MSDPQDAARDDGHSLDITQQSDAVSILRHAPHRVRFLKLDGPLEDFDFKQRKRWWVSRQHPDELLCQTKDDRFVLMHIPESGPERGHIEITSEDAAWWLKTDLSSPPEELILPPTTGRIAEWRDRKPGAPEPPAARQSPNEPPTATAPGSAARPTPENERQGETPAGATDCQLGPRTPAVEEYKRQARRFRRGELDDKAHQLLSLVPGLTNKEIAERLGCHLKSLSNPKLIKFHMLREELTRRKEEFRDLSRDGSKLPGRRHEEDDR